jgi:hypothetical protein
LLIEERAKTAILRRPVDQSPITQTASRRRFLLAGVVAVLACATGCGSSSGDGPIDVPALEVELATVMRLQQLSVGSELDVKASCVPAGSDSSFSCRLDASSRGTPVNSWTIAVACRPPGEGDVPRCTSENGYALQ